MKLKFKIVAINPSNEGKTHVLKLEVKYKLFGIEDAKKQTYYIGGMLNIDEKKMLGAEIEEDLANYWIVEREFETPEGDKMMLKWLHSKAMYPEKPAA